MDMNKPQLVRGIYTAAGGKASNNPQRMSTCWAQSEGDSTKGLD
jgi:hypothetical protein